MRTAVATLMIGLALPALGQSAPVPDDKLIEACAVWTFLDQEPKTEFVASYRVHRHVQVGLHQNGQRVTIECDFLDGEASIPELVRVAIDGAAMDVAYLFRFNALVWEHFTGQP